MCRLTSMVHDIEKSKRRDVSLDDFYHPSSVVHIKRISKSMKTIIFTITFCLYAASINFVQITILNHLTYIVYICIARIFIIPCIYMYVRISELSGI